MELRIKRSLCIAGCLSVLVLPMACAVDANSATFYNGKSYQKIITKGQITGAAESINEILTGDTFTVDANSVGTVGDISNDGELINSSYDVTVDTLTNRGIVSGDGGTLTILKGGSNSGAGSSITQNILNFTGADQTFTNSSDIEAKTSLTNNGIFKNNAGTIKTALLENTKTFTNDATISATNITNSGSFTNSGSLTTDKITNTAGTFTNKKASASIKEIDNKSGATYKNEAENTVTKVTNAGTFTNSAKLTATTVENTKTFTNASDLVVTTLNNTGDSAELTGNGNLTVSGGTNSGKISQKNVTVSGAFKNDKDLTSSGNFSNVNGVITGTGALTVTNGSSSASITQKNVTANGTFDVGSAITATENFTIGSSATVQNTTTGSIVANSLVNNNSFTNKGTLGSTDKKLAITNNGTMTIESGTLNVSSITNKANKTITNKVASSYDSITNETGATYNNEANTTVGSLTNSGNFNNSAEVNVSGSFTNNGANSKISGGTLNLANGGTNAGTMGAAGKTTTVNVNGGTLVNNNAVTNTTLKVANNAGVTNNGNITNSDTKIEAGGSLTNVSGHTISGGTVVADGKFDNRGTVTGSTVTINGSGDNASTSSGTITDSTVKVSNNGSFTNSGNINKTTSGTSSVTVESGSTFTNTAKDGKSISGTTITADGKFDNQGTVTGSTVTIKGSGDKASTSSGTITDSTVKVSNNGSFTNSGNINKTTSGTSSVTVESGSTFTNTAKDGKSISGTTITADGKFDNQGTVTGSTVTIKGSGDNASTNSGTITNSTTTVASGAEFTNSGTINGSGKLDVSGTVTNTNTIGGSLALNVNNGGVLNVGTASGTASVNTSGIVTIAGGGTLNITENGSATLKENDVWSGTVTNTDGTLNITGGEYKGKDYSQNGGTLAITGGSFELANGKTISNGTVRVDGGEFSLANGSNMTGGTVVVTSGTVGVSGAIADAVELAITDNIIYNIKENGNITIATDDTWSGTGKVQLTTDTSTLVFNGTKNGSNGVLDASKGNLTINSDLTVGNNSKISADVKTEINDDVNITGNGAVTINDNDTWKSTATVKQSGGSLTIKDYNSTTKGQGTLISTSGDLGITNSTVDITGNSRIDGNSKVTIENSTLNVNGGTTDADGNKGGTITLNSGDKFSGSRINLGTDGTFNYNNITSTGIINATGGNLNLNSGTLTLANGSNVADGAIVDIKGNVNLGTAGTGNSVLTLNTGDSWTSGIVTINENGVFNYNDITSVGIVNAVKGNLNVNSGTLTLANGSNIAKDATVNITGDVNLGTTGTGSSTLNLNTGDSWTDGVITVNKSGVFNYNDITSTGTLVAKDGTVNIASGDLTLTSGGRTDAGIAQAVKATVDGNLTVQDNVSVVLDKATSDKWSGQINLDGGSLDYSLDNNGKLVATTGNLNVSGGTLTLNNASSVAEAVNTVITSNVIVKGTGDDASTLNLNTGDSWTSGVITVDEDGVLNYSDITSTGTLVAKDGTVNIASGDLTLTSGGRTDAGIAAAVDASIAGNVTIKDNVSVVLEDSTKDSWTGDVTLAGGTLDYSLNSNGKLTANSGTLNVNGGTLTLDNGSVVANAVKTTVTGDVVVKGIGDNASTLNLNKTSDTNKDSWTAGVITVEEDGVLNYSDITSTGTLVAIDGTVNIASGNLTLTNTDNVTDAGIAAAVDATIAGNITIKDNVSVVLDDSTKDSWTGDVTLSGGALDYSLSSNGKLLAESGYLTVTDGTLTLNRGSYVKGAVVTEINSDVIAIEGGELNLNKNADGSYDSWASDAKVTLNGGTLNYADLTSNGVFEGKKGNLNTAEGSTFNVVGTTDKNPAYIGSDVKANIKGDLVIGNYGTVYLGTVNEGDAQDTVLGNITVNNGGTLNIYNNLQFKSGESSQLITIDKNGLVNLNTTGELVLNADFAGAGPIDKNGKGNVTFNGKFTDYSGVITINESGDLAFKHGLMGNLVVGDVKDGSVIGILADIIDRDLNQTTKEITMKYSTFHDNVDLQLAMEEGKGITITKGSLIAESKGDNDIIVGGYIDIDPADDCTIPVSMTATSNGSIHLGNKVNVSGADLKLSAGVDNNLADTLTATNKAVIDFKAGNNSNFEKDVTITDSTLNLKSDNNSNFKGNVSSTGSTLNLTTGNTANFDSKVSIVNSTMNLISGDSANFKADAILNGTNMNVISGNFNFNNLILEGENSIIRDMNGEINSNTIKNLDIYDRGYADFTVDVNGRDWQHDKFVISDITDMDGGQIHISDWQFADDWNRTNKAPIDRNIIMNMFDVSKVDPATAANIKFTQTDKEIFTPIGWYKLENYQKWNKQLGIAESVPGVIQASLSRYNPQVFRGQVATLSMYNNQLLVDDMLTNHVGLQSERFLNPNANKYALSEGHYVGPYQYTQKDGGLWMKNFASFEKLSMTQNLRVGNNFYGTLIGADMPVVDLKQGWKLVPTAYVGYNGAHQHFDSVSMYQNGAQLGLMGTFMKDDFVGSALVYGGTYFNEMKLNGYNEDAMNFFVGTAAKGAYNIHATKHFTVQPNVFVSYNFFGKQSWHSNFGDMYMNSGFLNGINVAPGMNLIYSRETWSMYATFQYMYNINEDLTGKAGNVLLHNVQMRHGYFQYGVGVTKTWKDRMNSYFQIVFRNGGRTGIGFQLGAQYLFDWYNPFVNKVKKSKSVKKRTIKQL